jgi:hypothetical protein
VICMYSLDDNHGDGAGWGRGVGEMP